LLGEKGRGDQWRIVPITELLEQLQTSGVIRETADGLRRLVRGDALRTLPGANFQGDGFFAVVIAREQ
jgi:hypothetical protein